MAVQTVKPSVVSSTSRVTNPLNSVDASTTTYTTIAPISMGSENITYSFTKPANTTSIKLTILLKTTLGNVNTQVGVYGESYNPIFLSYVPTNTTSSAKIIDITNINTGKFIISVMDDINATAKVITLYDVSIEITTSDSIKKMYLGSNLIDNVMLGTTQVDKIYLGSSLIFQK